MVNVTTNGKTRTINEICIYTSPYIKQKLVFIPTTSAHIEKLKHFFAFTLFQYFT